MNVTDTPENARSTHDNPHYASRAPRLMRESAFGRLRLYYPECSVRDVWETMLRGELSPAEWVLREMEHGRSYDPGQWRGVDQVYLARMLVGKDRGPVKIGRSRCPVTRTGAHQTSSPFEVILLGSFPTAFASEIHVHQWFASDRIRGEWFRYSARLGALGRWMHDISALYPPPPLSTEYADEGEETP